MAPRVSAVREDLEADTKPPRHHVWQGSVIWKKAIVLQPDDWELRAATLKQRDTGNMLQRNNFFLTRSRLFVDLSIRVGGFQLIAGSHHGQATDHAIHIEAVGRTGAGLHARLG